MAVAIVRPFRLNPRGKLKEPQVPDTFYDHIEAVTTHVDQLGGHLVFKLVTSETLLLHAPFVVGTDHLSGALEPASKERRAIRFAAIAWLEKRAS